MPPHLRMTFQVVDGKGKVLDEGKDLAKLQVELAPANRRAIAESLGATPGRPSPDKGRGATGKKQGKHGGRQGRREPPRLPAHRRRRPPD